MDYTRVVVFIECVVLSRSCDLVFFVLIVMLLALAGRISCADVAFFSID